jgi:hypothetical protein
VNAQPIVRITQERCPACGQPAKVKWRVDHTADPSSPRTLAALQLHCSNSNCKGIGSCPHDALGQHFPNRHET